MSLREGHMAASPKISVVIPAFNAADTIDVAIRSALGQTYRPLEIIVVDDGSTDATASVAARFGRYVTLVRQTNQGAGQARNTGANTAAGDWLAFLDADDAWLPQKLEKQVALTRDPRVGVVSARARAKSGTSLGPYFHLNDLWKHNDIITSSVLVRRSTFELLGGFCASSYCEDYHFWLRLAAAGWMLANYTEDLVIYSPAPGSLSQQLDHFAAGEI